MNVSYRCDNSPAKVTVTCCKKHDDTERELEQTYAGLADELNDTDVTLTEEDFTKRCRTNAKRYALGHRLPYPPSTGDFDRYYELTHP